MDKVAFIRKFCIPHISIDYIHIMYVCTYSSYIHTDYMVYFCFPLHYSIHENTPVDMVQLSTIGTNYVVCNDVHMYDDLMALVNCDTFVVFFIKCNT